MKLDAWKQAYFGEQMPACALQGHWASFRLVDETGSGKAYGGLPSRSMTVQGDGTSVN